MQHAGLRRQLAQHSPFGAGRAANSARCVVTRANRKASALSNLLAKDAPGAAQANSLQFCFHMAPSTEAFAVFCFNIAQ